MSISITQSLYYRFSLITRVENVVLTKKKLLRSINDKIKPIVITSIKFTHTIFVEKYYFDNYWDKYKKKKKLLIRLYKNPYYVFPPKQKTICIICKE